MEMWMLFEWYSRKSYVCFATRREETFVLSVSRGEKSQKSHKGNNLQATGRVCRSRCRQCVGVVEKTNEIRSKNHEITRRCKRIKKTL